MPGAIIGAAYGVFFSFIMPNHSDKAHTANEFLTILLTLAVLGAVVGASIQSWIRRF